MKQTLSRILIASFLSLLIFSSSFARQPLPGPEDFEPGVLLVKFKAAVSAETISETATTFGVQTNQLADVLQAMRAQYKVVASTTLTPLNIERWQFLDQHALTRTRQTILHTGLVEYVEPNYQRVAQAPRTDGPNDTYYQAGNQWWLEAVSADRVFAENILPVGQEVIVAVLDSGILLTHEDLTANLVLGKDYVIQNGVGNDDDGHGTHVAGIAGAVTNNNLGMAGIAGTANVKLMPIKILDHDGFGYDSDIAQGVIWAVDHGARVLNLSFGSTAMGKVLEDAIAYAYQKKCVIIASAGNDGDLDNPVIYPAAYDKVIAVAACTLAGVRAAYSEYHDYVDLAAPGGDDGTNAERMLSTYNQTNDSYAYAFGTSMAAPVVSGVAALLVLQDPRRTAEEIKQLLVSTADKIGSLQNDTDGWNRYLGWGRVNCFQALTRFITFQSRTTGRASYNYPNPFSPVVGEQTHILIPVAETGARARLRIFDSLGYLVCEKDNTGTQIWAGSIITWDGHDKNGDWVANGVYPYILDVDGKRYKNKIVVLNK